MSATELEKAVSRWVEAKRQQVIREDTKGDLGLELRKQELDVEDALYEELRRQRRPQKAQRGGNSDTF